MTTKNKLELPSPPTFSQLMEDLEIMASDDKIFKLFQLEQLVEQCGMHFILSKCIFVVLFRINESKSSGRNRFTYSEISCSIRKFTTFGYIISYSK
jgi:hypothetical protein